MRRDAAGSVWNAEAGLQCLLVAGVLLFAAAVTSHGGEALAPNPSFEKTVDEAKCSWPAGWICAPRGPNIAVVTNLVRTGGRAVRMSALGRKGAHQSVQIALPVKPGARYSFELYVRNDELDRLSDGSSGVLTVEYFDERDIEVGRASSETWDSNLSRLRWTRVEVEKVKAPKNAINAKFVIHFCELERPGRGSFMIDDVAIVEE